VAQTAVRFSFDSSVSPADLEAAAQAVVTAVVSVRTLGRA
jgi:cysteine desulfurase